MVKDSTLSLLWLRSLLWGRFHPWPRNFFTSCTLPKKYLNVQINLFLVYSQSCVPINTNFRIFFITPKRNPMLISSHFPFLLPLLPGLGNHWSTFHPQTGLFWTLHRNGTEKRLFFPQDIILNVFEWPWMRRQGRTVTLESTLTDQKLTETFSDIQARCYVSNF